MLTLSMMLSFCSFTSAASTIDDQKSVESSKKYIDIGSTPKNIQALMDTDVTDDTQILESDDLYQIATENTDGTGKISTFTVPVKYIDSKGKSQYIDTSMVSNGALDSLLSDYKYKNAANDFTVEYSDKAEKGIKTDNAFTMAVDSSDSQEKESASVTHVADGADKIAYSEAYGKNTCVEYESTNTGVKENIILNENIGKNTFDFTFNSDIYDLVLTEDSSMIYIVDKSNHENIEYAFSPIYVYDSYKQQEEKSSEEATTSSSFKHYTEYCNYVVTPLEDNSYKISVVVSEDFLNNSETVYPVTIDPTFNRSYDNIDDTYVCGSSPDSNYYTADNIRIGMYNSSQCYGYISYYSRPTIPTGANITSATMTLQLRSGQTTGSTAAIRNVTSVWYGSSTTYNSRPANSGIIDTSGFDANNLYYNFNITSLVNSWYNGSCPDFGVMISYADESVNDYNSVYSSDCGDSNKAPLITYDYAVGQETPRITSGTTYFICGVDSGKYLDVAGFGTNVQICGFNGGTNQQWTVVYEGYGYYSLTPVFQPSYRMDVYGGYDENSANIQIYPSNRTAAQRYKINPTGYGSYTLMPGCSTTRVLDVSYASHEDGANVELCTSNGGANQQWVFENCDTAYFCASGSMQKIAYQSVQPFLVNIYIDVYYTIQNSDKIIFCIRSRLVYNNDPSWVLAPTYASHSADYINGSSSGITGSIIQESEFYNPTQYVYYQSICNINGGTSPTVTIQGTITCPQIDWCPGTFYANFIIN